MELGKAMQRFYNDLLIKCKYYDDCKKICKLGDLPAHEAKCQHPKCKNYKICENYANLAQYKKEEVCDRNCLLLS